MENPTKKTIVQKLRITKDDSFLLAEKYYAILSAINNLKFTQREIQLMAFTAVSGNMSYKHIREEFCKRHDTTSATINNIISKLKRMGVLVKNSSKIKVNPVILLDFNNDVMLEVKLFHGEA